MARSARIVGPVVSAAAIGAILLCLIAPGCTQNQDNSPIRITSSEGPPSLTVACSTDGSIAYVTDGRNVYLYERGAPAQAESWRCILSQGERRELAIRHDPREQPAPASR